MPDPLPIRIFLSSPGDVADERAIVAELVDQLNSSPALANNASLDLVSWEEGVPLLANQNPQDSVNTYLPRPSECDIVIVIFWSRMGTPLPHPEFAKPDGSPYLSGTEWEYLDARRAAKQTGTPHILIYRRTEKPAIDIDDPDLAEKAAQWRLVQDFFAQFHATDGSSPGGYNAYETAEDFRTKVEKHLHSLLSETFEIPLDGQRTDEPPLIREVRAAAHRWDNAGRPDHLLWRHEQLAPVYEIQEREHFVLGEVAEAFVRPEAERLLEEFEHAPEYQRRVIIDRWLEIGEAAVPQMADATRFWLVKEKLLNDALAKALEKHRESAMVHLSTILTTANKDRYYRVCFVLDRLGDPVDDPRPFIAALSDEAGDDRRRAAKALGELGNLVAVQPLIEMLSSPRPNEGRFGARASAATALGQLGDSAAVQPLIAALADKDSDVRNAAIAALGQLGDFVAVKPLTQALTDDSVDVRYSAASVLSQLGDPVASQPIIEMLLHTQPADLPRGHISYSAETARAKTLSALKQFPTAVQLLIQALTDKDSSSSVRRNAATILRTLGDPTTAKPLIQALTDKDSSVRSSVATTLGTLGDPTAVKPLIQALTDNDKDVRSSAAVALGKLGDPAAVPFLINALSDEEASVRDSATTALYNLGTPEALAALPEDIKSTLNRRLRRIGRRPI